MTATRPAVSVLYTLCPSVIDLYISCVLQFGSSCARGVSWDGCTEAQAPRQRGLSSRKLGSCTVTHAPENLVQHDVVGCHALTVRRRDTAVYSVDLYKPRGCMAYYVIVVSALDLCATPGF